MRVVQFRKSKSFGPVRLTASKRGLGISAGAGPVRISRGADGKVRRTVRAPGTGLYDTKVISGDRKKSRAKPGSAARPAPPQMTAAEQGQAMLWLVGTVVVLIIVITLMITMGRWFFIVAGVGLVGWIVYLVMRGRVKDRAKKAAAAAKVPAGWLPDPKGYDQLRYWDGDKWTPHVHPHV